MQPNSVDPVTTIDRSSETATPNGRLIAAVLQSLFRQPKTKMQA
jgi:hypothetical protein